MEMDLKKLFELIKTLVGEDKIDLELVSINSGLSKSIINNIIAGNRKFTLDELDEFLKALPFKGGAFKPYKSYEIKDMKPVEKDDAFSKKYEKIKSQNTHKCFVSNVRNVLKKSTRCNLDFWKEIKDKKMYRGLVKKNGVDFADFYINKIKLEIIN